MTKLLDLEQFLNAPALPEELVDVPELGGAVKIRAFTKAKQQELKNQATLKHAAHGKKAGEIDSDYLEMLMLVHGVVEPELKSEHVIRLKQHPAGIIDRINKAILRINGMSEEAQQDAERTFPQEEGSDQ